MPFREGEGKIVNIQNFTITGMAMIFHLLLFSFFVVWKCAKSTWFLPDFCLVNVYGVAWCDETSLNVAPAQNKDYLFRSQFADFAARCFGHVLQYTSASKLFGHSAFPSNAPLFLF